MKSPWLTDQHRAKLVHARALLSDLVTVPMVLPGHEIFLPIQSNTEEEARVLEAMDIIEKLLQ